jgi:iron(III) transport system permease protein
MKKRGLPVQYLVFGITIALLLVIVAWPLLRIVVQSFIHRAQFSLANYREVFGDRRNYVALIHSFTVSAAAMFGATIIGTFLAWLVARTDLPRKNVLRTAFVFPFIMPPFVGALAWLQILGPAGYINKAYMALTGATSPLWNIYGPDGIILVLTVHGIPLVFITVVGALERMNPELEEVAQASGARPFTVMGTITLPLMAPSIASGAVLVFIHSMANFGIPAILGFQENYYVLTTKIWEAITLTFGLSLAAALSCLLGIIAGLGLLLQRLMLKRRSYAVLSGKSIYPNLVALGRHRNWLSTFAVLWVLATAAAPVLAILLTALTRAYGLAPLPGNLTLLNFAEIVKDEAALRAIRNSVFLAVSAATIITFFGALIAYIVIKTKMRMRHILDFLATLPYAIPGSVVALAMILAWLQPLPIINVSLYNTIWILLIAYVARYLTFGVRTTSGALTQIHESLEEAARISGANWLQTFRHVIIPLIAPGLFAGWFLVFMPSLRELTISALLWSPGNETIGVIVFNLQESGNTTEAAALAVVMMLVLLTANLVARKLTRGRIGY